MGLFLLAMSRWEVGCQTYLTWLNCAAGVSRPAADQAHIEVIARLTPSYRIHIHLHLHIT